ncbi:MAG: SurA N-terminal domain-containing protein [Betaproteobacteria bacterium]|nr:SurA N-terminal domain-containing protein [Betaproteobacteria bacterium]
MLELIRNNRKLVQLLLAMLFIPFAFFGVDAYFSNFNRNIAVATVGSSKITHREFQESWKDFVQNKQRSMGENFRREEVDTLENRFAHLNGLINQRAMMMDAERRHLQVSDALLRQTVMQIPAFQGDDGKFSAERYQSALRNQNMTIPQFEQQVRESMTIQMLLQLVGDTSVVSSSAAGMMARIQAEERRVAEIRLLPEQFNNAVRISEDAVRKYYEENRKAFEVPEEVRAEYVVLSVDSLIPKMEVGEAAVQNWYEQHKSVYSAPETRRVSHIMIGTAGMDAQKKEEAKKKAEGIRAKAAQDPSKFADLAREYSQDTASAAKGGDLGFLGRESGSFETAVFQLQEGEISQLVETDSGFHVIRLTGIQHEKQSPLSEVRPRIEAELKRQAAEKMLAESAEDFQNIVYEQPDSLEPAASRFKLAIQKWPRPIARNAAPLQPAAQLGPFANEQLRSELFSVPALENKLNTKAVEVSPKTFVAARVLEHTPASVKPLESVKADIEARLRAQEAAVLARKDGEEKLARLQKGEKDSLDWALVKNLSRLQGKQVPQAALRAIFKANVQQLPAYVGLEYPNNGGYALFKIMQVTQPEGNNEAATKLLQKGYTEETGQQELVAFIESLRKRYKVEIHPKELQEKSPE